MGSEGGGRRPRVRKRGRKKSRKFRRECRKGGGSACTWSSKRLNRGVQARTRSSKRLNRHVRAGNCSSKRFSAACASSHEAIQAPAAACASWHELLQTLGGAFAWARSAIPASEAVGAKSRGGPAGVASTKGEGARRVVRGGGRMRRARSPTVGGAASSSRFVAIGSAVRARCHSASNRSVCTGSRPSAFRTGANERRWAGHAPSRSSAS